MKKKIIIGIILLQIVIIATLWKHIQDKKAVLSTTSINPIKDYWITTEKTDELNYFYEPKPNLIVKPDVIFPGLENVSYTLNEDGLNQTENYSLKKNENMFRIMTIGDSHTFGQNVNTTDNYPSQLQKLLDACTSHKKFEVLNLGVYGYDIRYTVERLKKRGLKYHPDIVIWLFVPDDFKRINESLIPKLRQYTADAKKSGEYTKQIKEGNFYAYWNKARDDVIKEYGGEDKIISLQKEYMESISKYYQGPLILVSYSGFTQEYRDLLIDLMNRRQNTWYFDTLPNIHEISGATLPDLHPSKDGYSLIATEIEEYLIKNNIILCK